MLLKNHKFKVYIIVGYLFLVVAGIIALVIVGNRMGILEYLFQILVVMFFIPIGILFLVVSLIFAKIIFFEKNKKKKFYIIFGIISFLVSLAILIPSIRSSYNLLTDLKYINNPQKINVSNYRLYSEKGTARRNRKITFYYAEINDNNTKYTFAISKNTYDQIEKNGFENKGVYIYPNSNIVARIDGLD